MVLYMKGDINGVFKQRKIFRNDDRKMLRDEVLWQTAEQYATCIMSLENIYPNNKRGGDLRIITVRLFRNLLNID